MKIVASIGEVRVFVEGDSEWTPERIEDVVRRAGRGVLLMYAALPNAEPGDVEAPSEGES